MATATVAISEKDFAYDPFAVDVMRDPYPYYKVLREKYPVYRLEQYDAWALSRYADILQILTDPDAHLTTTEGTLMNPSIMRRHNSGKVPPPRLNPLDIFPNLPSPYYERIRQSAIGPLRPNAVAQLENFVRTRVRERLDELIPRGRFNATVELRRIRRGGHHLRARGHAGCRRAALARRRESLDLQRPGEGWLFGRFSAGDGRAFRDAH